MRDTIPRTHWPHWAPALAMLLGGAVATVAAAAADLVASAGAVPPAAVLEAAGARIGRIEVESGEIFDVTDPRENRSLYRLANHLHLQTQDSAIRAQLLFREGDVYSRHVLEETERSLRGLRFLREPTVRVVAYHDGLVDVAVRARDVWTMSPGIAFGRAGGHNSSGFEFEDFNFLGRGKRVGLAHRSNSERSTTTLRWVDPNLFGSRWTTDGAWSDSDDGHGYQMLLERPFFALNETWSAGIAARQELANHRLYSLGEPIATYQQSSRFMEIYGGTSSGRRDGWVRRWTYGLRGEESRFADAPGSPPSVVRPADRTLAYPFVRFELIEDDFATTSQYDQIGVTEDLIYGKRYVAELGLASPVLGSDRTAQLLSAAAGRGWRLGGADSLFVNLAAGGRIESGTIANGTLSAGARYFHRSSERRTFYASIAADFGSRLDADREFTLGGDVGLRGYPLGYQSGSGRILLTLEQRFFTNWQPLNLFRVGGALFFDAGYAGGPNALQAPQLGLLKDVGFGLRFANSKSAIANVLHFDVAFPLDRAPSIDSVQFLIKTKRSF